MCDKIHCFEAAGLGKAPFRYVGMENQNIAYGERVIGNIGGVAITTKPGGTCDYCGTYIINIFVVESADGNRFKVGCDCIRKVSGEGSMVANLSTLEKDLKAHKQAAKRAKDDARIAAAKLLVRSNGLLAEPHPTKWLADDGKTLADYCEWLFANAGQSGQLRAAMIVENYSRK